MNLVDLVRSVLKLEKRINLNELPSQGLFYKNDFSITIKRASTLDIEEYEKNFNSEDIPKTINKIKKIVKNNTHLFKNYTFNDFKSIDIIYIFFEIVKFTKGRTIDFTYTNNQNESVLINFSPIFFNYYDFSDLMKYYDKDRKCFKIDGYLYNLPTIGVEDSLIKYLLNRINTPDSDKYSTYFFDFTHFLLDKNTLTDGEIDNLIHIFNFDIEPNELNKVKKIVSIFSPLQKYTLIDKGEIVDINSKIDLMVIFK
jgi:hypothetical protein